MANRRTKGVPNQVKSSPFPESVPKPLAAFIIGHRSVHIRHVSHLFWHNPGFFETETFVPGAIEHIKQAARALTEETPDEVSDKLSKLLEDFRELDLEVKDAFFTHKPHRFNLESRQPPGLELWKELRLVINRVLNRQHPLRSIYDFGVVLGEYSLELLCYIPPVPGLAASGLVPGMIPLVHYAKQVPKEVVRLIPLMESLVRLAPVLDRKGQVAFIADYYEKNRASWSYDRSLDFSWTIGSMMDDLLNQVIERLEIYSNEDWDNAVSQTNPSVEHPDPVVSQTDPRVGHPDPGADRPSWNKQAGELLYRGKIIRSVRPIARCIITVLDSFEELFWENPHEDPLGGESEKQRERLRDTIASLNAHIEPLTIRFSSDGTGERLIWKYYHENNWICPFTKKT